MVLGRCFLALELSEEVRLNAIRLQALLRQTGADLSCPHPDRLHLTLLFLGDLPDERLEALTAAVDRVVSPLPPFAIRWAGVGFFGPPRRPRVVWAGVDPPSDSLIFLQKALQSSVKELRFTFEDRPYVPHLTLGRIRSGRGLGDLTRLVDSLRGEPLGLNRVERVSVMCSQSNKAAAPYTVLHQTRLQGE